MYLAGTNEHLRVFVLQIKREVMNGYMERVMR